MPPRAGAGRRASSPASPSSLHVDGPADRQRVTVVRDGAGPAVGVVGRRRSTRSRPDRRLGARPLRRAPRRRRPDGVVRRARRRRRSCSSWRRTRGTPTTTSTARTCTRAPSSSSFARPLAPGMLAKDDATPRLVRARLRPGDARPGADDVARHGRVGGSGAPVRALGRGATASPSGTRRTPTSRSTPTSSTAVACCSASATTSTGRGACATRSRPSSPAAATSRSCPATRATGRSADRGASERSATVMVGYKHRFAEDPVQSARTTTMWSDPITGRPETDADRRLVHARRLPPDRVERPERHRRLRGPSPRPLAAGRHRPAPRRPARRRPSASSATSATAAR